MSNVYESGAQKVIPATLVYALFNDQVLMIKRDTKVDDYHFGIYNGLGGKFELNETPLECAVREFKEEAGIEIGASAFRQLGLLQFPNFKPHKREDWLVFVFRVELNQSEFERLKGVLEQRGITQEGTLEFVSTKGLLDLPLWEGDVHFLPFVVSKTPFQGSIFYEGRKATRVEVKGLLESRITRR